MILAYLSALLLSHMVADYPLQTDWMAKNKHDSHAALFSHVIIHGLVAAILTFLVGVPLWLAVFTGLAIFGGHGVIDALELHIRWDQTAHLLNIVIVALIVGV